MLFLFVIITSDLRVTHRIARAASQHGGQIQNQGYYALLKAIHAQNQTISF
jgi:hypothetical protein